MNKSLHSIATPQFRLTVIPVKTVVAAESVESVPSAWLKPVTATAPAAPAAAVAVVAVGKC